MSPAPPAVPDASSLRLEVLGKIASGGMARVDLARDLDADRLVALKRLHVHLERDPEFVSMFMDEAWMTAAVDHPNIVKLLGSGRDVEGMFLVMELVDGPSLQGLASEARRQDVDMPAELLAFVGLQCARGLAAMHELCDRDGTPLGLVHRDLTPSNILIGSDGSVRITDFGVAKAAGRTSKTSTDVIKGKTRYLSPEYAASREVDARSDLYTLGLSLYVAATGRQPFEESDSIRVVRAILAEQPPLITDFEPDFDVALSELVDELQRKDPWARPENARQVAQRLERWIADHDLTELELQLRLARFADNLGAGRRERIEQLTQSTVKDGAAAALELDDEATTRVAIAQRGAPEQQQTRLARVQIPPPPPVPSAPEQVATDEPTKPPGTRVVSRPKPAAAPVVAAATAAPADPDPSPGRVSLTEVRRVPGDDPDSARARPATSIWPTLLVSTAVAAAAVITIILTRPGDDTGPPAPATSASPTGPVATGATTPPAASPTPGPTASASAAIDGGTPTASQRPSATAPPRTTRTRPRPTAPPSKTKPRPCDPSHFDYPKCLSR